MGSGKRTTLKAKVGQGGWELEVGFGCLAGHMSQGQLEGKGSREPEKAEGLAGWMWWKVRGMVSNRSQKPQWIKSRGQVALLEFHLEQEPGSVGKLSLNG